LSSKAVADSNTNLNWLKETTKLNFDVKLWQNDVKTISQKIELESIDLIVTEPFLGPPQTGNETPQMITKIREDLADLYSKALSEFQKILKKGGVVCMIWPIFTSGEKQQFLPIYDQLTKNNFKIIKTLTSEDKKNLSLEDTERGELVYKREGQKVLREIVLFRK
jgi:tRNA G10  N-methylase Trm11